MDVSNVLMVMLVIMMLLLYIVLMPVIMAKICDNCNEDDVGNYIQQFVWCR